MLRSLTLRGRCLLAAGTAAALCAIVLDERDLLRVAAFVAALPLLAMWLSGRTRVALGARREVDPGRVAVGSDTTVRLHLGGRGRLPAAGLYLEDGVPYALGGRPHLRLDRPPGQHGTVVEYRIRPALRGIHRIGPLHTRVRDPFGLAESENELAGHSRLVAVPRVVSLTGLPAGSGLGAGEDGDRRLRAGHGEDDTMVREYRHGDDMRRVHWKMTARRDELMVRLEERPRHGGVTVLIDHRAAAHRGTGAQSSIEWAISAAASICLQLHARGQRVRLVTVDGSPLTGGVDGYSGGDGDTAVLDALAALQPSPRRDLMCGTDPGAGQELIAVLGSTTATGVTELTKLRPHGAHSRAVLLNVRRWSGESTDGGFDTGETASRLRASGWTVATADGPDSSIAAVWDHLCRQSSPMQHTAVPR
ncbi:uncharacterized protein (DUF58 family) [Halopolyspora algeriensis]|uniref:Uncharacterized protein (DUF58 family) n=1 Tax=Halopolyspora algeriensis TaxID=1500506 RepID=A0A368VV17_9ACTN|nr:DUF58 domain-containing protein [Halopolyspora algeriensis]RCW43283.1 uncharacterized protein (DUF58 family) [Halopolyspora algeriensis]TQM56342.1 uncharacterized protein (DUF58 family) [Halopolyspora algeriensis]